MPMWRSQCLEMKFSEVQAEANNFQSCLLNECNMKEKGQDRTGTKSHCWLTLFINKSLLINYIITVLSTKSHKHSFKSVALALWNSLKCVLTWANKLCVGLSSFYSLTFQLKLVCSISVMILLLYLTRCAKTFHSPRDKPRFMADEVMTFECDHWNENESTSSSSVVLFTGYLLC